MPVLKNIFLHFFNSHFVSEKLELVSSIHRKEIERATQLSLIFADVTYIPIASYIESDFCNTIIDKYIELLDYGVIEFVGKGSNLNEYLYNKKIQYPEETPLGKKYWKVINEGIILPFKEKNGSTTKDLIKTWNNTLTDFDNLISIFNQHYTSNQIDILAKKWEQIPKLLENKAFIVPYICPHLVNGIFQIKPILNRLHRIMNTSYFNHFISEYNSGIITDLIYLNYQPLASLSQIQLPYKYILQVISNNKKYHDILIDDSENILKNRNRDIIHEIYNEAISLKNTGKTQEYKHKKRLHMTNNNGYGEHKNIVFISYNHQDSEVADKIKAALENADIKVIIDKEVMSAGADIKEFIESCINESTTTVSLVSNKSLKSAWVAMETINTFFHEKFSSKKFIACYIDDDFFKPEFTLDTIDEIDAQIKRNQELIPKYHAKMIDTRDLNNQNTRFLALRNNLDEIVRRLRESLCLDVRESAFDKSIIKLISAIKN